MYGIDVSIISPPPCYTCSKTVNLTVEQTSCIVAAVLGGSIPASLVAGVMADWIGRKKMMIISGLLFVASVGLIVISQSFIPLFCGRFLQGISGGVIAVVVPLYLAETLGPNNRGKGTAVFQFMLTVGIVIASLTGWFYTHQAEAAITAAAGNATLIRAAQDHAWRGMFLSVISPGVAFFLGAFVLSETPRWLVRHGKPAEALAALRRSTDEAEAQREMHEIETLAAEDGKKSRIHAAGSLLQKRYVIPFILACIILTLNQTTGSNSILAFLVVILKQAGMTANHADPGRCRGQSAQLPDDDRLAVALVDRKGRKFLLKLGTGGIVIALAAASAALSCVRRSKRV